MNLGTVRVNKCGMMFIIAISLIGFIIILSSMSTERGGGGGGSSREFLSMIKTYGKQDEGYSSKKVSLKALLAASIDVAERGGREVVEVRNGRTKLEETIKGKTKEGVQDSATEGDFRSHKIMYYGLRKAFPSVKVISEEHTETPNDLGEVPPASKDANIDSLMPGDELVDAEDVTIWIDPLDATKEYTENLVGYVMTMVGIAVKGRPIVGVLHQPFTRVTYWAVVGHSSSPNLNRAVAQAGLGHKTAEDPLRIIVSRSHAGQARNFSKQVLGVEGKFEIIEGAGAGYKVVQVIENKADVYLHVTAIKKWDLCAGYAILNALGGLMTTVDGEDMDFSGHSEPLNTKGVLAYMNPTVEIEKLKRIRVGDDGK